MVALRFRKEPYFPYSRTFAITSKYKRLFTWDQYSDYPYCEGISVIPSGNVSGSVNRNDDLQQTATSRVSPSGGADFDLTGETNSEEPDFDEYYVSSPSGTLPHAWRFYTIATLGAYSVFATIECDSDGSGNRSLAQASASVGFGN